MQTGIFTRHIHIAFFFALLACAIQSFAQDIPRDDETVSQVIFIGNRRTTEKTMERIVGARVGLPVYEVSAEGIRQRLLFSNLFAEVSVSIEHAGSGAVVTVTVEEKITRFPLPYGSMSDGGWTIGCSLIDTNFLGEQKTVVVMGSLKDNGWSLFGLFVDPSFLGSSESVSLTASASDGSRRMTWGDGDAFAEYSLKSVSGGASVLFPLFRSIRMTIGGAGVYSEIDDSDVAVLGLSNKATYAVIRSGLRLGSLRTDGHFQSGLTAAAEYQYAFSPDGEPNYQSVKGHVTWFGSGPLNMHKELGTVAEYGNQKTANLSPLRGKGFRTLPQQTSFSSKVAAGYAEVDLPVCQNRFGMVTVNGFYEFGSYETGPDDNQQRDSFMGPGIGISVYLDKVAIPALGVNAAYNIVTLTPVITGSFGLALN